MGNSTTDIYYGVERKETLSDGPGVGAAPTAVVILFTTFPNAFVLA
jgi:hypothetical protein